MRLDPKGIQRKKRGGNGKHKKNEFPLKGSSSKDAAHPTASFSTARFGAK